MYACVTEKEEICLSFCGCSRKKNVGLMNKAVLIIMRIIRCDLMEESSRTTRPLRLNMIISDNALR